MKKSVIISIISILLLSSGSITYAQDTEYKATPVTVSKDKVRNNGKLYYSHVVLAKQTLFSISKAYNVTIDEIVAANPELALKENGLNDKATACQELSHKGSAACVAYGSRMMRF